jgi:hypothetical protein
MNSIKSESLRETLAQARLEHAVAGLQRPDASTGANLLRDMRFEEQEIQETRRIAIGRHHCREQHSSLFFSGEASRRQAGFPEIQTHSDILLLRVSCLLI